MTSHDDYPRKRLKGDLSPTNQMCPNGCVLEHTKILVGALVTRSALDQQPEVVGWQGFHDSVRVQSRRREEASETLPAIGGSLRHTSSVTSSEGVHRAENVLMSAAGDSTDALTLLLAQFEDRPSSSITFCGIVDSLADRDGR